MKYIYKTIFEKSLSQIWTLAVNKLIKIKLQGGLPASDEMCVAFIHYYPKVDLSQCDSRLNILETLDALGIDANGQYLE